MPLCSDVAPDLVAALVAAIELKDRSTAAHTWRVVLYTRTLAEEAKLSHDFVNRLTTAAALHDVGKIDIRDEILQKPGPLTNEEFEAMKRHTTLGHLRLKRMGETDDVILDLVRHHHERWDGLGYPDGQKGEAIPLAARYFAVVDSFDAMTSVRPYRNQTGIRAAEKAIGELRSQAGSRYFPDAVDVFGRLYETGKLNWILEYFNDSCPVRYEDSASVEHVMRERRTPGRDPGGAGG